MITELLIRGERESERERGEREQERGKRERERGERERARTSACNETTEGQKFFLLQIFFLFHLQSLSLVCFFVLMLAIEFWGVGVFVCFLIIRNGRVGR